VWGFKLRYRRPEDGFAHLEREGAELVLEGAAGPERRFRTAQLEAPFGRGVNFQIEVSDGEAIAASFAGPRGLRRHLRSATSP
jgi:hypothetical protein